MARRLFVVRVIQVLAALVLLVIALPASALADDWLVTKLRGEVLQLVGADWAPLNRGDVVPDERAIRTLASGRAVLQRGGETIEISANTQIRIFDKVGGKRFTTVQQHFGTVAIEAEVQNVRHFAVQTPYLAAVVKGTRFEVKTTSRRSQVKVRRGLVAVEDGRSGLNTLIAAGQSATVGRDGAFAVGGRGPAAEILSEAGEPVMPQDAAKGRETAPGQLKKLGVDVKVKTNNGKGPAGTSVDAKAKTGAGGAGVTVTVPGVAGVSIGGNGGGNGNAGGNGNGNGNAGGNGNSGSGLSLGLNLL